MQAITTIGLDIAKSVFQVHAVDAEGNVILRRQLKRRFVLAFFEKMPPCLVGIEACPAAPARARSVPSDPLLDVRWSAFMLIEHVAAPMTFSLGTPRRPPGGLD